MSGFIYLGTCYSHPVERVRQLRYAAVNDFAARLLMDGIPVFSPISQSHSIADYMEPERRMDHAFWMRADLPLLGAAAGLLVFCMPGWEQSRGLKEEMEFAAANAIPSHAHGEYSRTIRWCHDQLVGSP